MHPNIIGFVASVGIVLSLLSGKLFAYAMERIISSRAVRKCSEGGCGEFGWIIARRDSESCHAYAQTVDGATSTASDGRN